MKRKSEQGNVVKTDMGRFSSATTSSWDAFVIRLPDVISKFNLEYSIKNYGSVIIRDITDFTKSAVT